MDYNMDNRDKELYQQYLIDKETPEYKEVFEKEDPLVSVVMATYNAGEMLCTHSLRSVLNQTHTNLEIIIIDDGSIDDTEERILAINDPRIYYEKIKHIENMNWFATSVAVINYGISLCKGDYVAHLDDDDWFLPEKIKTLVDFNRTAKAEIVHHPFLMHHPKHETYKRQFFESQHCTCGQITTSSLFYHGWFSKVNMGGENLQEMIMAGDWDKARKILEFGGKSARCPEMLLIKNGHRHCDPLRNRIYRPQYEPPPYRNIKWGED